MTLSPNPPEHNDADALRANPGYALGQLARAFATSQDHPDPATRERAVQKIARWVEVYEGMLSGSLSVGSRTPVAGAPPWATLEVVKGGFATGALLAGGPLQEHERALLARLPALEPGRERAALNAHYLSEAGLQELRQMLAAGTYRVGVPEEGALLAVAWLLDHGQGDAARAILDAIGPYLNQLRFYPAPDPRPLTAGYTVHLNDVATTIRALDAIAVPAPIARERETIQVWLPLYDQIIALFAATIDGPPPTLRTGPDGTPLRGPAGSYQIEGGWPCQRYPLGWSDQAAAVLNSYRQQRARHQLSGRPEKPNQHFAQLRRILERCVADPAQLSGREVGMVRFCLAAIETRRGLPGSARAQAFRQAQAASINRPTHRDLARVAIERLAPFNPASGLDSLDGALAPVSAEEALRFAVPAGSRLPRTLETKLLRCLEAPAEVLVERGVIRSGEVLARVFAQITAQIRSAGLADPALRRLADAIYAAFRRRRSLLLLNFEHQVRIGELPWMQAIDRLRVADPGAAALAAQTLGDVVALTLGAFPYQILPNKLLQELRALAASAGLNIPIVDELAADIFMGDFTAKYLRAAQIAGRLLEGSLYERYYAIPYAEIRRIDDIPASARGPATSAEFRQLCYRRAAGGDGPGWSVARNGTVIEQQQILTTQNLAALFDALGLAERMAPQLDPMARRCLDWIFRRQQQTITGWVPRLRMIKNTAYAWRQMVFYLALRPPGEAAAFLAWAYAALAEQRPDFAQRFAPALHGLAAAINGRQPAGAGTPVFLGWTVGRHWLLEGAAEE